MPAPGRPPPRRSGGARPGRPAPTGRSGRPGDDRRGRRDDAQAEPDRSRRDRPSGGRSASNRPASTGRRRSDRPTRASTAAERRAAEVNATRPRRPPPDPDAERAKIEARTLDTWIDEGSQHGDDGALHRAAARAAGRAGAPTRTSAVRRRRSAGPAVAAAISAEVRDPKRAAALTEQLGRADAALDRERFDEARRLATPLLRTLGNVAAVHELIGLAAYRSGRWRQALSELQEAQSLEPSVELLPVLADVHRALRQWSDVDRIWSQVRASSPAPEILAEARIVAAGALADRGDLTGALRTMERARSTSVDPKRVRDHHLRQWYVLGDLHDRAGDAIEATRWFEVVARHDADFVDVTDRLRALGR